MRFSRCYLEITNRCNLACSFCPKTKRPARTLTAEEFRLLAGKLRAYTDYLYLHVMGEPLLHPQLQALLETARALGFRVALTTNGTLLPARQALLLAAPALYKINISLHSFEANVAGSFDDYLSGCFTFAKLAAETGKLVDLRLWNLDGETTRGQHTQNDAILAALEAVFPQPWTRNTWGLRLCERVFVHYAEKFDWPDLSVSEQRDTGTCRALKDQLAVLSDGTVVPCCLDHEGDVPLGNLFSQELDEILRALPAQALLSGFAARKLTQPLCRRCGYARRFRLFFRFERFLIILHGSFTVCSPTKASKKVSYSHREAGERELPQTGNSDSCFFINAFTKSPLFHKKHADAFRRPHVFSFFRSTWRANTAGIRPKKAGAAYSAPACRNA